MLTVGLVSVVLAQAATAQTLTGVRIEGPDTVPENATIFYRVFAGFDDGREYEVTLDASLLAEPGTYASFGLLGDLLTTEVPQDVTETVSASYSFQGLDQSATLPVTIEWTPLHAGQALSFDGSDDIVRIPPAPSLGYPGSGGWTIEAWIFPRNIHPSLATPVFGQISQGVVARDPYNLQLGDGEIALRVDDRFRASQFVSAAIAQDQWTHVAGVYAPDDGTVSLFINGDKVAWSPISVLMEPSDSYPVIFGGQGDGPRAFDGLLDEVRIWAVARTYCEVRGYARRSLKGTEPGLVGYWRLNDSLTIGVRDSSPLANHGSLGHTPEAESSDPSWAISQADLSLGPFPPIEWTAPEMVAELSSGEDWTVAVSADGTEIYLGSERDGFAEGDLYRATRSGMGQAFSTPTLVTELSIPGYIQHDNTPFLSANGLRIYFRRQVGHGQADLYVAQRASLSAAWGEPSPIESLNTASREEGAALTADELHMVFVTDRSAATSTWTASRQNVFDPWTNLQPIASLQGFAMGACALSHDGLTLHLAAQGPTTLGGRDIWRLVRPTLASPFGEPKHLIVLSSAKEEYGVSLTGDGKTIFIVRQRSSNAGDVYMSRLAIPGGPLDGEINCDGVLDLADYSSLADCLTGPDAEVSLACELADLDTDGDVDLRDYQNLENRLASP